MLHLPAANVVGFHITEKILLLGRSDHEDLYGYDM